MILEHLQQGEPGAWKIVFRASAEELARALEAQQAAHPEQSEEDRMAGAVNAAILDPEGFSPVWAEAVDRANLVPVTDPDFNLLAVNPAEGFRAEAEFFALPPLTLGRYTGFVQAIRPRPIRRLSIELEINQHHGPEDRAADEAGKAALRQRVTAELYAQRCRQARMLAERKLVVQLGDQVTGPLPRQLVGGNYFAEQRRFNLSLQAQRVNFDQAFLGVTGFHPSVGFSCGINDEAFLKQTAIRQSEQVIALMDSSKIGVKCSFSFCGLNDIDIIVSDGKLPEEFLDECRKYGVEVL